MNYENYTNEQLIIRIKELEILNKQLLTEKQQQTRLEYAWTGNLGHWYWNIKTNDVTFDPLKITALGYEIHQIPKHVTYQFFTDKIHPEDHEKTMQAMRDHLYGKCAVYEVEYRIMSKNGNYKWYYDRGKITRYDETGEPAFLAGIVFDITEKKEFQIELENKNKILTEQTAIDGLTKIGNHRSLMEKLNYELLRADKQDRPLSVALFDLDDFKKVNDTKGHIFGDKVLKDVAAIIVNNIRNTDFAGRYGGEEFMILFLDTDILQAEKISQRIRQAVEKNNFGNDIRITISGGAAQYKGEDASQLIHAADMNLYKAKNNGKNKVIM